MITNSAQVSRTDFQARTVGDRIHGRCECGMVPGTKHYRSGCVFALGGMSEVRSKADPREKGDHGKGTRTGNQVGAGVEPPTS